MFSGWIKISSSLSHRTDIYTLLLLSGTLYYFECFLFCFFCLTFWLPPVASRVNESCVLPFLCPSVDSQCLLLAHSMSSGNVCALKKWSDEWITWLMGVLQGIAHGRGICLEEGAWGEEGTEGRSASSRTHSSFLRKHCQILLDVGEMMHLFNILDHSCHIG